MDIDEKDKQIMNELIKDARQSYREIAKKLHFSVATVMNHVNKFEKSLIKKYTAQVDYEMLGYDIEVIIEIGIAKGRLLDVEKKIASHPNVFAVYDVTGDFDAVILARFKNRRTMDTFLKKIQKYDFVARTQTKLVLNTIKETQIEIT